MTLAEALAMFPPTELPLQLVPDARADPRKIVEAAQVIADHFRRLKTETGLFIRFKDRLIANSVQHDEFVMVRRDDLLCLDQSIRGLYSPAPKVTP